MTTSRQDPRGSRNKDLRQATDEGLSYPVYMVQKHVSSKSYYSLGLGSSICQNQLEGFKIIMAAYDVSNPNYIRVHNLI